VKQDREWEDRDRWRFLCNSRPKKLEEEEEEEEISRLKCKKNVRVFEINHFS
jgi:hypothetical protein